MSRASIATIAEHIRKAEKALQAGPLSVTELAEKIGVPVKVAGRLVPALRKGGYPVTQTHGKDGRVPLYSIGRKS
jgi:DNA-binding MarR family transcriptional regulator